MTTKQRTGFHIRWMIRRDMEEVLANEQASFDDAWTEADFLRALRQRNVIGMVPVVEPTGEPVVGHMIYALEKTHLEVLNFAVGPAYRRRGAGRAMVDKLKSKLSSHRHGFMSIDCRESNLGALLFFKSQGFIGAQVLRGQYDDTGEDAIRMIYRLGGEDE